MCDVDDRCKEIRTKFSDLFEYSLDLIYIHDIRGNFLDANDVVLNALGYSKSEIKNIALKDLIENEQFHNLSQIIKEFRDYGKQKSLRKYKLKSKKGNYVFVETYGIPIKQNGSLYAILNIGRDVTKRKLEENALAEHKEISKTNNMSLKRDIGEITKQIAEPKDKYKLITESFNDFVYIINTSLNFEYINENVFKKEMGYKLKELIGKSHTIITHPDDAERCVNILKNLFESEIGEECLYETRERDKQGVYHWFEVRGKLFIDYDGKSKALLIARDISKQKEMLKRLKKSKEHFNTLIQSTSDAIIQINDNDQITYWNRGAENIFGYKEKEILGKKIHTVLIPKHNYQLFLKGFEKFKETGKGIVIGNTLEMSAMRKDGSEFPIELSVSTVKIKDRWNSVGIVRDITYRKIAEKKLAESQLALKERVKELRCMYGLSKLMETPNLSGTDILKETLNIIPQALQYPHLVCMKIRYGEYEYKTDVFKQTNQNISFHAQVNEKEIEIQVYCTEDRKFLEEEKQLLLDIGNRLKLMLEQKILEGRLIQSEKRYRTLFESSVDGIVMTSLDGYILDCNKAFLGMLDYEKDDLKKLKYQDFTPEKWYDMERKIFNEQILTKGFTDLYEKEYIRKDGSVFPINIIVWLIKNQKDIPIGMWGIVRDITLKKEIESKLKESEENYRKLYEQAPSAYFTISPNGSILKCNKTAEELLSYTFEELSKMKVVDLYMNNEFGADKARKIFKEFTKGKEVIDEVLQMERKDGKPIWISLTVKPVHNEDGNVIESRSIVINIDDRIRAQRKLIESEEKYREVLESIKEGYFEVDLKGKYTFFNKALCDLTEYSKEELLNIAPSDFYDQNTWNMVYKRFNELFKRGEGFELLEYEAQNKKGKKLYVETSIYLKKDSKGKITGFKGLTRDATERKNMRKLSQKNSIKYYKRK